MRNGGGKKIMGKRKQLGKREESLMKGWSDRTIRESMMEELHGNGQ